MSKNSKDTGLTHLEGVVLPTEPGGVPVASKAYDLPLKHHKFVKDELQNLLEAGLIQRYLSPYAVPIIVVPCEAQPGSSLTETKSLVIDYHELNKQLPKVQTAQAKSKSNIALIETDKIDHIWARLKGAKYFFSLDIKSWYHHISIHPESWPKTAFICPYGKFQWKRASYQIAHTPSVFLSMFKLFWLLGWFCNILCGWCDNLW